MPSLRSLVLPLFLPSSRLNRRPVHRLEVLPSSPATYGTFHDASPRLGLVAPQRSARPLAIASDEIEEEVTDQRR
jgi:hypothetical protein